MTLAVSKLLLSSVVHIKEIVTCKFSTEFPFNGNQIQHIYLNWQQAQKLKIVDDLSLKI